LKAYFKAHTAQRRSQGLKEYYKTHDTPNKGVPHKEATKRKISEVVRKYGRRESISNKKTMI
jgi:hypothetical protein